jgi:hypothetical protein
MPCAITSGRPTDVAIRWFQWMGLKSPEAPAYRTRSARVTWYCRGAISAPAVRSLSRGAAVAGCYMDTGEGGLSPYHLEGGCDIIMQIGTAKYGIRDKDGNFSPERAKELAKTVKAFEIKMSQGAKPGKGGVLPGGKVTAEIAAIRGIPEGQDSISPNRHRDIANVDELLDKIAYVRFASVYRDFQDEQAFFNELKNLMRQKGS